MYRKYIKRILDFILSLTALVILSPVMFIIAILIRIKLGSPIVFRQQRSGLNEKIFTMHKFRTMTDKRDKFGVLLSDRERITKFGKWLRSTSLDELPELWDILKGEMSIVGPRPLLIEYLPYYTEEERKRHAVRPGLTGWAQVNGRNLISWEDKFNKDIEYISSITFMHDFKIIIKTVINVINRKDILAGDEHIVLRLDEERKDGSQLNR